MTDQAPVRVLYIAGYGRSGTTILDIVLGQHGSVLGAGEIGEFTRHVWESNEYCACGSPIHDCRLWAPVMKKWAEAEKPGFLAEYRDLQRRTEGLFGLAKMVLGIANKKQLEAYGAYTQRFFETVQSISRTQLIVDSSKLPGRAMALSLVPGIDLRVIHVVRDGRGVAWSLMKSYKRDVKSGLQREIRPKSASRTALRWSIVNIATELLLRKLGARNAMRVRYEDFTTKPAEVLEQIGKFVDIDFSQACAPLLEGQSIKPGHQLAGNKLRMSPTILFSKDESWRAQMPRWERISFQWLSGWLLRRYGYDR